MRFFNFILFCKYNIIKRRREIVKVVFVGGDIRQKIASDYLNEHHIDSIYISHPIDIDLKNYASVLVLPLPVSLDGVHLNTNNDIANIIVDYGGDYNKMFKDNVMGIASGSKRSQEIAKEVIKGLWGNGITRKLKLAKAGYNYAEIQKRVNELLK